MYHDVVIQVSDDPEFKSGVRTVFNNDHDNSAKLGQGKDRAYIESYQGRIIDAQGATGPSAGTPPTMLRSPSSKPAARVDACDAGRDGDRFGCREERGGMRDHLSVDALRNPHRAIPEPFEFGDRLLRDPEVKVCRDAPAEPPPAGSALALPVVDT